MVSSGGPGPMQPIMHCYKSDVFSIDLSGSVQAPSLSVDYFTTYFTEKIEANQTESPQISATTSNHIPMYTLTILHSHLLLQMNCFSCYLKTTILSERSHSFLPSWWHSPIILSSPESSVFPFLLDHLHQQINTIIYHSILKKDSP